MFLVQKCLGSSFPEDVWAWWLLMHWLQLQFTPCEALSSVWIGFAWQYSQACAHPCCLCTFSSFQSTLHLICFDKALLEQPLLSVMIILMCLRSDGVFAVCGTEIRPSRGHGKTSNPALHVLILLSHHRCIQGIDVCLRLCTSLHQFSTYVPLEACERRFIVHPKETLNHLHRLLH